MPGNHENKLVRALDGRNVQVSHGLAESLSQLAAEDGEFRRQVRDFARRPGQSHLILDGGRLVVAHAGLKEAIQGRASGRVRSFALYGDTTGETDEFGLPVRYPWASDYRGRALVVYGHTPVPGAGVGEQHDLHRHRLRVRRPAHRAALPGAGTGLGPRRRRPTTSRPGRCGRPSAGGAGPGAPARGAGPGSADGCST